MTVLPGYEAYDYVTVTDLSEIVITFDDASGVEVNTVESMHLSDGTTEYPITAEMIKCEGNTVTINVASITCKSGEFEFAVPAGAFIIMADGKQYVNGELYTTYVNTTTGIANVVAAEDGKYVVYNVNGVLVLSTENAADLNLLEGGLYIVNGKKVLVRK